MKTDYKNINSFEASALIMILAGVVIIGGIIFSGLNTDQKTFVTESLSLIDMHEEAIRTAENAKFVWGIPGEFYEQFYVAFVQVATLPEGTLETPVEVASILLSHAKEVASSLNGAAVDGVANRVNSTVAYAKLREPAHDGKVMGAMINLTDQINTFTVSETAKSVKLNFYYEFVPPQTEAVIPLMNFIKIVSP